MAVTKRALIALALAAAAAVPAASAFAQEDWPSQPVKIIVPVAPGGTTDGIARLLQEPLSQRLGQPVVIENKPGSAGVVATDAVAKAPADGYTFGIVFTSHAANPAMMPSLPYDTEKDLVPVAFMWRSVVSWSVPASSPIQTFDDLVAAAQEPGAVIYGTGGVGQASHFSAELFEQAAGVEMTHAPYRGAALATADAIAGQLPLLIVNTSTVGEHARAGTMRILATASPERSKMFPDVPTLTELGYPVSIGEFNVLVAPAGTDPAILQKFNAAVREAMASDKVMDQLNARDLVTQDYDLEEVQQFIAEETERMGKLVEDNDIRPQ
ncbi:tripartite tricarboxylate transporter substrate binding protein [Poseidonocella sp. HB161398]|uniref:Bug family tripartite tricarboxylate transporter substrate binding protein n=1 Tax=Poseidonocella sp. HB161398 TaxID=2320855 RepID=UPI001108392B|nr:tripartite tricarboxylate transporter substrate-binding protein [Poseidonocella sp. HB161398]